MTLKNLKDPFGDFRKDTLTALTLEKRAKPSIDKTQDIIKNRFSLLVYVTQCLRKYSKKETLIFQEPLDYKK